MCIRDRRQGEQLRLLVRLVAPYAISGSHSTIRYLRTRHRLAHGISVLDIASEACRGVAGATGEDGVGGAREEGEGEEEDQ
eukprot:3816892-Rhodomonas_salina.1